MTDLFYEITQKLDDVIFSSDEPCNVRNLLEDLLIRLLDNIDQQVMRCIRERGKQRYIPGVSKKTLLSVLEELPEEAINKSLEKLEQLDLIYVTSSERGVLYDLNEFRTSTTIGCRYFSHEEPPITRYLQIDYLSGDSERENSRIILEGYGGQQIALRLKDMEPLLKHLEKLVQEQKKIEFARLKKSRIDQELH